MTNSHDEAEHSFDDSYFDKEEMFGNPYQELQDYFQTKTSRGTVLDLGSGQGRDALYLAKLGYQVTAVDNSRAGVEQMLKKAEEQGLYIVGIVADILELRIAKSYDIILFDMVLHSFEVLEQVKLLKKYSNNVKKGGYMCLIFPDDVEREQILATLNSLQQKWK